MWGSLGEITSETGGSRRCRESGASERVARGQKRWTGELVELSCKPGHGTAGHVEDKDLVRPRCEDRVDSTAEGVRMKTDGEKRVDSV